MSLCALPDLPVLLDLLALPALPALPAPACPDEYNGLSANSENLLYGVQFRTPLGKFGAASNPNRKVSK